MTWHLKPKDDGEITLAWGKLGGGSLAQNHLGCRVMAGVGCRGEEASGRYREGWRKGGLEPATGGKTGRRIQTVRPGARVRWADCDRLENVGVLNTC